MTAVLAETNALPLGSRPLWQETADRIAALISADGLAPGVQLPSERELGERLGVSRVTLRRALQTVAAQGLVASSRGRGWFVAQPGVPGRTEWPNALESFSETAARLRLRASSIVVRQETGQATIDEAEALGLAPGTPVLRLDRVRCLEEVPIGLDSSVLVLKAAPAAQCADFTVVSLYRLLAEAGITLTGADATIEAVRADADVAGRLDLAEGEPVLRLQQVAYDAGERPVLASSVTYAGKRYRMRTYLARVPTPPQA